jgi:hypothetical protein
LREEAYDSGGGNHFLAAVTPDPTDGGIGRSRSRNRPQLASLPVGPTTIADPRAHAGLRRRTASLTRLSAAIEWGSTAAERSASYPCEDFVPGADLELFRAIDISAPVAVVFRWLCQLRAAPYSYDLLRWRSGSNDAR